MCGIVGFINTDTTLQNSRWKWIEQALYVDQLRGVHSTGLVVQNKPDFSSQVWPDVTTYKKAVRASDFLQLETTQNVLFHSDTARVVIGHNRSATRGDKDKDSFAHPFTFGATSLVHNGTLMSDHGLTHRAPVDSCNIAHELAHTTEDKYTDVLSSLDGAFALVWNNSENKKVYITRNSQRPLYVARAYNNKTLFFASEDWMITFLLNRINPTALDEASAGYWDMWEIPELSLLSIDYTKDTIDIETEEYKEYEPPKHFSGVSGNHANYNFAACPYKIGDVLFSEEWAYEPNDKRKGQGKIVGKSADFIDVSFVSANMKPKDGFGLMQEVNVWKQSCMGTEDENVAILLEGEVSSVTAKSTSGKRTWVVTLKPSSLKVESYDLTEMAKDVIKEEKENTPENKIITLPAPTNTNREGYRIGNLVVSKDEWVKATEDGCHLCGCDLYVADAGHIGWLSVVQGDCAFEDLKPLCQSCRINNESVKVH